jgi:Galactose-3-O-sulfotransferase
MAFDAGLETSSFRDPAAVYKLVLQMEEHFDLVLIAEQMERSLVLLADALCWPMDDVVWLGVDGVQQRASNATTLTEEQRQKARALNAADVTIYEHFTKSFRLRMRRFGEQRMADGLKRLRTRTRLMAERCAAKADAPQECSLMAMSEEDLTKMIRQKQLERFGKYANAKNQITTKRTAV